MPARDARGCFASWRGATGSWPASRGGGRSRRARWSGVDELTYAGNHGLELLAPGASEADARPGARRGRPGRARVRRSSSDAGRPRRRRAAARGQGPDPGAPLARRRRRGGRRASGRGEIAERGRAAGLEPHWGRKVLEIRPVAGIDKGTAVRRLLARRSRSSRRCSAATTAPTSTPSARCARWSTRAGCARAVCVGIASAEGPPELSEQADAVVAGPEEFLGVLTALAQLADGASGAARG